MIIRNVLPLLGISDKLSTRQGAMEAVINILDHLGLDILPYIVLLIVPVLGRMSDQSDDIRLLAANCFATLVQLMPLEAGTLDPPSMPTELIEKKIKRGTSWNSCLMA